MITVLAFVGRLLIALLFIVSGVNKLFDIGGTQALLAAASLPTGLAIPVGLFELVAGLALVFGFMTRLFAVLLAGFSLLAALLYHNNFLDPIQAAMLLKDIAIAGGLLCLCAADTARWSYDAMRERRRADLAEQEARQHAHQAEIREARAEGAAAATHSRGVAESSIQGRTVIADSDGDGIPDTRERR